MQYYFEPLEIPGKSLPKRFQSQFEYLFFYLEPELKLASNTDYPQSYLEFLKKEFSLSPKLQPLSEGTQNYWFFEGQPLLFDKIKIYELLKGLNLWDHDIFVAYSKKDLKSGNYLSKSPFGFSGRGVRELNENLSEFPFLVEEQLDRFLDFSYYKEKDFVFYQNLIGDQFDYQGSRFEKETLYDFDSWFKAHEVSSQDIQQFHERKLQLDQLLTQKNFRYYNVDCFLYRSEGEVKIHFACEVNLRKTMGYLLSKVYIKYFSGHPVLFFNLSKSPPGRQERCLGPLSNQAFYITYNFENDSL